MNVLTKCGVVMLALLFLWGLGSCVARIKAEDERIMTECVKTDMMIKHKGWRHVYDCTGQMDIPDE